MTRAVAFALLALALLIGVALSRVAPHHRQPEPDGSLDCEG